MALPTMSPPALATPLDATGKRKRSLIDLTEDEDEDADTVATVTLPTPSTLPTTPPVVDDDSDSMIEDYADHYEMAPFQNGTRAETHKAPITLNRLTCDSDGLLGLSEDQVNALRARLKDLGPDDFLEEVIREEIDLRRVGVIFGLNPDVAMSDSSFVKLLGLTISRAYWKRQKICKSFYGR